MRKVAVVGLTLLVSVLRFAPTSAQDMAAMSKWATAQVIHYHVSGDFTDTVPVVKGRTAMTLSAKISDHVEFDFDWDNLQQKPIGQPAIKNFPTKVEMDMKPWAGCTPKVTGTYEYWTMDSTSAAAMMFTLNGKRSTPAGSLPWGDPDRGEKCGAHWETVAASTPAATARMQLAMGMMLVMPSTQGYEMEITPDKKSFIQKINTDGWVFTQTPTIVR